MVIAKRADECDEAVQELIDSHPNGILRTLVGVEIRILPGEEGVVARSSFQSETGLKSEADIVFVTGNGFVNGDFNFPFHDGFRFAWVRHGQNNRRAGVQVDQFRLYVTPEDQA